LRIERIDSEVELHELEESLGRVDGILIPGGFGTRGIEGKIHAATFARINNIPYFGICLGMQVAMIAFVRTVCGLDQANSREFDEGTPHPVIDLMSSQKAVLDLGGTMRLGAFPCKLRPGTKAQAAYGKDLIHERHRHRYEVNNQYRALVEENGMRIGGVFEETDLVEMVELVDHPWYVACQFHPEFLSRPLQPHPLFRDFIGAVLKQKRGSGKLAAAGVA